MKIPKGLEHQSIFFELGEQLVTLCAKKNADYGSAFEQTAEIMKILYPDGIPVHQYLNATLITRMLDKICRIANQKKKFYNEDGYDDLAGYGLIAKVAAHKEKLKNGSE